MAKEISPKLVSTVFTAVERAMYTRPKTAFPDLVRDTLYEAEKHRYPKFDAKGKAHVIAVNYRGDIFFLTSCQTESEATNRARETHDEDLLLLSVVDVAKDTIFLPVTNAGTLIWER